jgi:hypothetical protein
MVKIAQRQPERFPAPYRAFQQSGATATRLLPLSMVTNGHRGKP